MGRTTQSQGLAPPAVRKDIRSKQARHIVNKVIPAILASNARARNGAEGSELIVDPGPATASAIDVKEDGSREDVAYSKRKGQGRRKVKGDEEVIVRAGHEKENRAGAKGKSRKGSLDDRFENLSFQPQTEAREKAATRRRVRIIATDTLTAAHMLTSPSKYTASSSGTPTTQSKKKQPNPLILNMASPLRPGGGVLTGATSQEEFLCARTTLLPSLKDSFYRLPEIGGVFTRDVLVFRNSGPLGETKGELGPGERFWIDVVSAAMLRFPELEGEGEGEVKRLGKRDRRVVEEKMRGVLRIACSRGARKVVLGAWGCGAYGNPVGDIARAWRVVLDGRDGGAGKKGKGVEDGETWDGIEEVTFAISNRKMAGEFAKAFGGDVEVETGPGGDVEESDEEEEEDQVAEELRRKIQEMEVQVAQVWNPDLKARMGSILDGLRAQLRERVGRQEESEASEEDEDEDGDSLEEMEQANGPTGQDDRDETDEDDEELDEGSEASQGDDDGGGLALRERQP